MGATTFLALMYHEIGRPDRPPCDGSPGYLRYVVPRAEFEWQLGALRDEGFRGVSISQALASGEANGPAIAITFDDGCETDAQEAAPLLLERGFGATFFIVPAFLGRSGYLSADGVRALAGMGFEIGSHGMTHRFLTALDRPELERELRESKETLEQICGTGIVHLSCPGGRWNRGVADAALSLGYRSVSTSRIGRNDPVRHRTRLARLAIRRGAARETFRRRCHGIGLERERWRAALFATARRALGDSVYDSLQRRFG